MRLRVPQALGALVSACILAGCAPLLHDSRGTGPKSQSASVREGSEGSAPSRTSPASTSSSSASPNQDSPVANATVASANPLATHTALTILQQGGSAVDAVIAAQMVLGLVEPQSSGVGGGSLMLHWDAGTRRLSSLDGLSASPATVTPDLRVDVDGRPLPPTVVSRSGRAVGVPGTLPMLALAHRKHGRLPWATLFGPAADLAERGFPMPAYLHSILSQPGAARTHAQFADLYFDADRQPLALGTVVRNPAYARTMRAIGRLGAAEWLARTGAPAIVAAVRNSHIPGLMVEKDLLDYQPQEREPVCAPFLAYRVCSAAPPSHGGVVVLQVLQMLESLQPARYELGDPAFAHLYAEAGRLAQADRRRWVGDPAHVAVPLEGLLARDYLAGRAATISAGTANPAPSAGVPPGARLSQLEGVGEPVGATSQIAIVDAQGNVVSMTTTINLNFGARIAVEGFVLNNVMINFGRAATDGSQPANRMQPNKRPLSAMAPTIVFDARGEPVVAGGSAGGGHIVDYVASALIDMLAAGMTPRDALARGHLSTAMRSMLTLEMGTGAEALADALRARGHEVEVAPLRSGLAFIKRDEHGWQGAADPRRDGNAATLSIR